MNLFNRRSDIEIESFINPQSAIRNPQSHSPLPTAVRYDACGCAKLFFIHLLLSPLVWGQARWVLRFRRWRRK
jgi:hypothetical protein